MGGLVTTADVGPTERFDFWHDVVCSAFVRLEAESLSGDAPFAAAIDAEPLGPLTLSRVHAQPHAVHRSARLVDGDPRDEVLVSVQLSGTAIVAQDGREAMLRPGDFALYDATRPYDLTMPGEFEMLVLQFERQFLIDRCPSPESLTAICMPSMGRVTAPVSSFLRALQPSTAAGDPSVSHQLASHAVDLIGLALASQAATAVVPGATGTRHFLRACTFINANSDDSDLDPERVADAVGVSLRYLHQLFRERHTTVNGYLLARRLARCKDDLSSAACAHRTITAIACARGFKTGAHFSRRFTEAFDQTPREFRRQHD